MARIRHIAILTDHRRSWWSITPASSGSRSSKGVGTATYLSDGHVNLAIIPKGPEEKVEGHALESGLKPHRLRGGRRSGPEALVGIGWARPTTSGSGPPNRESEYRVQDPDGNLIDLSQHGWPV